MKKAIKAELKSIDSYFKELVRTTGGSFVRTKFASVTAKGKQPTKEISQNGLPDYILHTSHRTNPGNVKPLHFPNHDSFSIYSQKGDNPFVLIVLTDGHGTNGHFVSMIASCHLCRFLIENTACGSSQLTKKNWESLCTEGFKSAENACGAINTHMSGATCTVLFLTPDLVIQANVGDSLAVLCSTMGPEVLTMEDKPSKKEEADRIKSCGGKVINLSGSLRVFPVGLAITRAIGDIDGRKYGVICTPHVTFREIGPDHTFLIVGSDGVWDEISPAEIKRACSKNYSIERHEKLVSIAQEKYLRSAGGYADDATLVYVNLAAFRADIGL